MTSAAMRLTAGPLGAKSWAVTRLCASNLTVAWAVTLLVIALVTIPSVIQVVQAGPDEYFPNSYLLSSGTACYVLLFAAPSVVATNHLPKVIHLNAAKDTFLAGAVVLYALLAATVAAVDHIIYNTLDQSWAQTFQVVNLAEAIGWTDNGPLLGFAQEFAALFLIGVVVHTLASLQRSWVGWIVDLLLIGLFGASLVVEPLISTRVLLLDMLAFHPNALVQIASCLVAAAVMYGIALTQLRHSEL